MIKTLLIVLSFFIVFGVIIYCSDLSVTKGKVEGVTEYYYKLDLEQQNRATIMGYFIVLKEDKSFSLVFVCNKEFWSPKGISTGFMFKFGEGGAGGGSNRSVSEVIKSKAYVVGDFNGWETNLRWKMYDNDSNGVFEREESVKDFGEGEFQFSFSGSNYPLPAKRISPNKKLCGDGMTKHLFFALPSFVNLKVDNFDKNTVVIDLSSKKEEKELVIETKIKKVEVKEVKIEVTKEEIVKKKLGFIAMENQSNLKDYNYLSKSILDAIYVRLRYLFKENIISFNDCSKTADEIEIKNITETDKLKQFSEKTTANLIISGSFFPDDKTETVDLTIIFFDVIKSAEVGKIVFKGKLGINLFDTIDEIAFYIYKNFTK